MAWTAPVLDVPRRMLDEYALDEARNIGGKADEDEEG